MVLANDTSGLRRRLTMMTVFAKLGQNVSRSAGWTEPLSLILSKIQKINSPIE